MDVVKYPVAELFCSAQGEGAHVGRLMIFLRLAGCTVGTRYSKEFYDYRSDTHGILGVPPIFPIYTHQCHIYDGRTMSCDTDYRNNIGTKTLEEIADLISEFNCDTVCITGGEPLMHDILPLVMYLKEVMFKVVHIETSGTIPITTKLEETLDAIDHIAISPKKGWIDSYAVYADELKILVDDKFNWDVLPEIIQMNSDKIWLQPINGEHTIDQHNMDLCIAIQKQHPEVLLSSQAHKLWGVL